LSEGLFSQFIRYGPVYRLNLLEIDNRHFDIHPKKNDPKKKPLLHTMNENNLSDLDDSRSHGARNNPAVVRVAVCCSVLQCVAVCCSVLQCVAVRGSVLQSNSVCFGVLLSDAK